MSEKVNPSIYHRAANIPNPGLERIRSAVNAGKPLTAAERAAALDLPTGRQVAPQFKPPAPAGRLMLPVVRCWSLLPERSVSAPVVSRADGLQGHRPQVIGAQFDLRDLPAAGNYRIGKACLDRLVTEYNRRLLLRGALVPVDGNHPAAAVTPTGAVFRVLVDWPEDLLRLRAGDYRGIRLTLRPVAVDVNRGEVTDAALLAVELALSPHPESARGDSAVVGFRAEGVSLDAPGPVQERVVPPQPLPLRAPHATRVDLWLQSASPEARRVYAEYDSLWQRLAEQARNNHPAAVADVAQLSYLKNRLLLEFDLQV